MPLQHPVAEEMIQRVFKLLDQPSKPMKMVHRDLRRALDEDDLDTIAIDEEGAELVLLDHGGPEEDGELVSVMEEVVVFTTEIFVKGTNVEASIRRRNQLYAWVVAQIASDRTLGGLVDRITERSRTVQRHEMDRTYQMLSVTWEARMQRREDDPRQLAEEPA